MKVAFCILICIIYGFQNGYNMKLADEKPVKAPESNLLKDQNCECTNWEYCRQIGGEVNSDVYCQGSYLNVCCIIPKPQRKEDKNSVSNQALEVATTKSSEVIENDSTNSTSKDLLETTTSKPHNVEEPKEDKQYVVQLI